MTENERDIATSEETVVARPETGEAQSSRPPFRISRKLVTLSESRTIAAESIAALRSHILAQHISDRRRSLTICSPTLGTGCTFLSANIAVALAQAGIKTLLMDANLREPGLEEYIQPADTHPGLLQCLDGSGASLGEALCREVLPNLSVLYAGGTADNAQELLASAEFRDIAGSCLRDFELTVVDTPPASLCADARRVSNILRYALVVARKDVSYVSDIRKLIEELQADRAHVVGTYLNEF